MSHEAGCPCNNSHYATCTCAEIRQYNLQCALERNTEAMREHTAAIQQAEPPLAEHPDTRRIDFYEASGGNIRALLDYKIADVGFRSAIDAAMKETKA